MCCGRENNQGLRIEVHTPAQAPSNLRLSRSATEAQFEYTGKTALTVVSPLTRVKYSFPQPGARVVAHARDRSWMAFVPHLRRCG